MVCGRQNNKNFVIWTRNRAKDWSVFFEILTFACSTKPTAAVRRLVSHAARMLP